MEDILNQKFTNSKGHEFTVTEYIGRDDKKQHVYTVKFTQTGNEYQFRRTHCRKGTARDLQRERIEKKAAKQKQKFTNKRMSKEPDQFPNLRGKSYIVLDQSSSLTGYCVVLPGGKFEHGDFVPSKDKDFEGRCFEVAQLLTELIEKHDPAFVAFESIYMSANASVAMKLGALLGMLELVAMSNDVPFAVVESMRWKNFFSITGSRDEQKAESIAQASQYIKNVTEDSADAFNMARYIWQNQEKEK